MSDQKFMNAMGNIKDEYLLEALPQNRKKINNIRNFSRIAIAVFALVVVVGLSLNAFMPVYARNLPFIGNVFAFIQNNLHVAGGYSNYAFEIGDKAEDNGLTITMSEAYCDGVNLYVSFVVESEKPFSSYTTGEYIKRQLDYDGMIYVDSKDGRKQVNDFGLAGLEGEFTDDFTFVGVDSFSLTGEEFPDEFTLDMDINTVSLMTESSNKEYIKGNWHFAPAIDVNSGDVVTYEINKEANGHTIDKIVVTPIFVTIYTSYPEIYFGTTNYEVRTYTDGGADEDISSQGEYGRTSGITQIPRMRVNNDMHIYVVDGTTLCKSGLERGTQEESKEHAIVSLDISID